MRALRVLPFVALGLAVVAVVIVAVGGHPMAALALVAVALVLIAAAGI